jgi:hypothetical protein
MDQQQGPPAGVVDGQDLRGAGTFTLSPAEATAKIAEIAARRAAPPAAPNAPAAEQARSRLEQLKADPKWRDRLLTGDAVAGREYAELRAVAATATGGDLSSHGIGETVNSLDDPNKQSRRAYDGLIDGLRARGLPDRAKQYLRNMDAGLEVTRPSEGDGIAARRARERLNNDRQFRTAVLSGEVNATNLLGALNRCIAWSVADGRPISDEIRGFLQARGLM